MVRVTFTNGTDSVRLDYVRNISWSAEASTDLLVSTVNSQAKLVRSITINGYINKSMWQDNVQAQQQLETDLQAVSVGSIQYDGLTDIEDARFRSLSFNEFRGNPLTEFTIEFETEADNVHAHTPISVGSTALSLANGFTDITVDDSISTQGDDERISKLLSRTFTVSGSIVGSDLSEVNANSKRLENELDDKANIVLSLSSGSGGDVYTVRPQSIEISSPTVRDQTTARTFSVSFSTYDDYTKEPYTLGETQQTFGSIVWDVVDTVSHDFDFMSSTVGLNSVKGESFTVSGKIYFDSWTSYDTSRRSFNSGTNVPAFISTPSAYSIQSASGALLTLREVTYGELERDGNYPITNAKRYSASVQGSWEFVATQSQQSISENSAIYRTYLGEPFDSIDSISPSVQLDDVGNIISRSVSVTGVITNVGALTTKQGLIDRLLDLRGKERSLRSGITGDDSYFITSVNINGVETEFIAGAEVTRVSVSISASKLDTAAQAKYFISRTFNLGNFLGGNAPAAPFIDNITSLSKSFSYVSFSGKETVESISINCSGEVWVSDNNGSPSDPTKNIELFNRLDSTLHADFPTAQSGPNGTSQLPAAGNLIPEGVAGESWTINSINVSQWESFVKPINNPTGERYWKQSISLSVKVAYDVTGISGGSGSAPLFVDTESESITEPSPKFVQLQVAGFGTVFKRIGTNPAKATTTNERKYRDLKVFDPNGAVGDPSTPAVPGGGTFTKVKSTTERRNLTIRKTFEFIQTD